MYCVGSAENNAYSSWDKTMTDLDTDLRIVGSLLAVIETGRFDQLAKYSRVWGTRGVETPQ